MVVTPPHLRPRSARILGAGFGIVALLALAFGVAFWFDKGLVPGDTITYYLAGARLNVGHALYDLSPGDPWHYDRPEFPLYGPPLLAVVWRLLVALPGYTGVVIWLVAMWLCLAWSISLLLLGTRGFAGLAIVPLVPSLVLLFGVANVDCLVLLGTVGTWMLLSNGRRREAGILVGVLVSVKLTPAVLLIWLVLTRRWTPVRWASLTILALAVVAILGTEPGIFVRYARVMVEGSAGGRSWALLVLAVGVLVAAALRRRSGVSFAVAAALMPIGSPVAAIHSWSLLLAALAPVLRRIPGGTRYEVG